jgi:hypothetical protein
MFWTPLASNSSAQCNDLSHETRGTFDVGAVLRGSHIQSGYACFFSNACFEVFVSLCNGVLTAPVLPQISLLFRKGICCRQLQCRPTRQDPPTLQTSMQVLLEDFPRPYL